MGSLTSRCLTCRDCSVRPAPNSLTDLDTALRSRARPVLLLVGEGSETVADRLADLWDAEVVSIGVRAAAMIDAGEPVTAHELLAGSRLVKDLDILFWVPAWRADVLALLRIRARGLPIAAVWPGSIDTKVASYSEPGRRDFYERRLEDELVVRTERTWYQGEVTFNRER